MATIKDDATALKLYREIEPDMWRIVNLVQQNLDYFGAEALGQYAVKTAADKLEKLIEAERK